MSAECYPIAVLPHTTQLYRDYLAMSEHEALRAWYGGTPLGGEWMRSTPNRGGMPGTGITEAARERLATALEAECVAYGAGAKAVDNVGKLRRGARAVVTGQQVGLLGGPLLTLLKAATAVARAEEATRISGIEHVPIFWLATEDHDLAEVDQVALPAKAGLETLRAGLKTAAAVPVGGVALDGKIDGKPDHKIDAVLERASELLAYAPVCDDLREFYGAEGATLGGAFARFMARVFADQGLIVMDAAGRQFHALGASTLRAAIEQAEAFETALLARTTELAQAGYHAQVLVKPGASLLFLLDETTRERLALRRLPEGAWKAGSRTYTTAELLAILEAEPERISPNALLRPIFQDTMLPTAAYIGGPAEVAYFAQSAVLYQQILGRITPVLPRLTATLIEPALAEVMARHELTLQDVMTTPETLAQRLGARSMPIAGKRKLAAVGNAMDAELTALTEYMAAMDESLGRSAAVSASKMRYQMNRLRRMAATFELQKEASLRKHADALTLQLFPDGHPQERVIGGVWFLARYGEGLIERLVDEAKGMCAGHVAVRL